MSRVSAMELPSPRYHTSSITAGSRPGEATGGRSLPPDRIAAVASHRDVFVDQLPASLVAALRALASDAGSALVPMLIAAFAVLLARYTGQDVICLGIDLERKEPGTDRRKTDSRAGRVAIEVDLTTAPPFMTVLEQVKKLLAPTIASSSQQEVIITYRRSAEDALQPDLQRRRPHDADLSLAIVATRQRLRMTWRPQAHWLDTISMAQLHGHFQTLLAGIIADANQPVSHLPLLTAAERRRIVVDWNATAASYPDDHCIHWLVEEQVRRRPHAVALRFEGNTLSYHELNTQANQLAHYLQRLGVCPETLVGICMERSLELIIAALGVLKAGGAYVPLDPAYPPERLSFMIEDSGIAVLLTRQTGDHGPSPRDRATAPATGEVGPTIVDVKRDAARIAEEPQSNPACVASADNLAYVIYTSGSTGKPKGVLLHHRGLVNLVYDHIQAFSIAADGRVLQFSSFSFDASVSEIFTALVAGATLHLARRETLVSPPDLVGLLRTQAISNVILPPSLLAALPDEELPALRTVVSAGESCSWELALRWARGRRFVNAYGPTEATVGPTCYVVDDRAPGSQTVPIGRPLPNYQIYILDRYRQPVPVGVAGELYIGGPGLARGYLNRPALTAERFVEWTGDAPIVPPSVCQRPGMSIRLYKTGDVARYLPDGNIEFLGRIDHQVKLRGFRIELGEIEAVLRLHPAVQDAIVLVREELSGDRRLVGYVTTNEPHHTSATRIGHQELRHYLRHHLADYMVPSALVLLPALPLTVNGKVDRRALPAPAAVEVVPDAAPRTPEEVTLAQIWAQVLGRSSIGIYDDFFALGGHSLLAARAIALVNARLDRSVPLRLLFDAPTVAAFALALGGSTVPALIEPADLAADVVLDRAIVPPEPVARDAPIASILLTGATGYLGSFLLHELLAQTEATIYCLVRAPGADEAGLRIEQTLTRNGIWRDAWRGRIVPVAGDLSLAQFGLCATAFQHLAATIDVIYHAGAQVHYLHSYETLKQANVQGTIEILRLACQERTKPVHYVSTLAVALSSRERVWEDDDLAGCASPLNYVRSKWVAEGVIGLGRARGLPVVVYRPGRIGCHSQTGHVNRDDFFVRLLAGCIRLGMAPDVPLVENLVPVDYTARAIVHLSRQGSPASTTFHLINPQLTRWSWVVEVAEELGYPMRLVSYRAWRNALLSAVSGTHGYALHSLLMLVPEDPSAATWIDNWTKQAFDTRNTDAGLTGSGLKCPAIDAPLLKQMLAGDVCRWDS